MFVLRRRTVTTAAVFVATVIVIVVAAAWIRVNARSEAHGQWSLQDVENLKIIATALEAYSVDNNGQYPRSLDELSAPYLAQRIYIPASNPLRPYGYVRDPANRSLGAYVIEDDGSFDPSSLNLLNGVTGAVCTPATCKYIIYAQSAGLRGLRGLDFVNERPSTTDTSVLAASPHVGTLEEPVPAHAPRVIRSLEFAVNRPPQSLISAGDDSVWVVPYFSQFFVYVDSRSGRRSTFGSPYHSVITLATSGPNGALWFLSGTIGGGVYRIERDGHYQLFWLQDRFHDMPGGLVDNPGSDALVPLVDQHLVVDIDSAGAMTAHEALVEPNYSRNWSVVLSGDGTEWFSSDRRLVWKVQGNQHDVREPNARKYTGCQGSSIAYLSIPSEPNAHYADYVIGWVSASGDQDEVRRWPRPKPIPRCDSCVRPAIVLPVRRPPPPPLAILTCSQSMAWVKVGDRLDRVGRDGRIETFSVVPRAIGREPNPERSAAKVWIYDAGLHRLLELGLN